MCIHYVEDRIQQNWDQMKDRSTWPLVLKDLLTTTAWLVEGNAHTHLSQILFIYYTVGQDVFWLVIFAGLPLILKGEETTTYHWQLHGNCYKFYA